jgi:DnaJ-class molecular chaperone
MSRKERHIVRMCGHCLGNGYVYRNGKRSRCESCRGEGVITVTIEVDEAEPEGEQAK